MNAWRLRATVFGSLLAIVVLCAITKIAINARLSIPDLPPELTTLPKPTRVTRLNPNNYQQFLEENEVAYIGNPYSCPSCGEFLIEKAAEFIREEHPEIQFAAIDCRGVVNGVFCEEKGIGDSYNSGLMWHRGQVTYNLSTHRVMNELNLMATMIVELSIPPIKFVSNVTEFAFHLENKDEPVIISLGGSQIEVDLFAKIAEEFRQNFVFVSTSAGIAKEYGLNVTNSTNTIKWVNSGVEFFPGRSDSWIELVQFIHGQPISLFAEMDSSSREFYKSLATPLGVYYYDPFINLTELRPQMEQLASEYNGEISFVSANATKYGYDWVDDREAVLYRDGPSFIIEEHTWLQTANSTLNYGMIQGIYQDGPDFEAVKNFVGEYRREELLPDVKFSYRRTSNWENPVVELVGEDHNDILSDLTKSYLVWYYDDKRQVDNKVWHRLAELYKSNSTHARVVIAQMDITANDNCLPLTQHVSVDPYFYPRNGLVHKKTGLRYSFRHSSMSLLESINFISSGGDPSYEVIRVTSETFTTALEESTERHNATLVGYFNCQELNDEFLKLYHCFLDEKLEGVNLMQINCGEDRMFCEDSGIFNYPTIQLFHHKPLDIEVVKAVWMQMSRLSFPLFFIAEEEDLRMVRELWPQNLILQLNGDRATTKTFYEVAKKHRPEYLFVIVDPSLNGVVAHMFDFEVGLGGSWVKVSGEKAHVFAYNEMDINYHGMF
ncbi:hypothetical protein DICA0_B13564 [Diutina catenulata]